MIYKSQPQGWLFFESVRFYQYPRPHYLYPMIYFISGAELVFVFLVILLVFGADRVPDIARTLGKGMRQVRNATQDIKEEIQKSAKDQGLDTQQIENQIREIKDEVEDTAGSIKRKL